MTKVIQLTGSYLQNEKHALVSNKFNVIQAASVGEAMTSNGLQLVSLSTGKAKHEDKANFQRTLSRYRGPEISKDDNGMPIYLDIIYDSKHMGRGVDKILLGIYRTVCTNGLITGSNFFKYAIRHNGNTYDNLNQGIVMALESAAKLTDLINRMKQVQLSVEEQNEFANNAVKLLTPKDTLQVMHHLLKRQRQEDTGNDLWSVFNVVQENGVRGHSIGYTLRSVDNQGKESVRAMNVRAIKANTARDADFNQGLFDVAAKLVA